FTQQNIAAIPAITICYPTFLSMELMAMKYPELQPTYDEYLGLVENIPDTQFTNKTFMNILFHKYYGVFAAKFNSAYSMSLESIHDISIPFKQFRDDKNELNYPVDITVKGVQYDENGYGKTVLKDMDPIESYSFGKWREGTKCFTFFSHLNPKWRGYKLIVEKIKIDTTLTLRWYPVNAKMRKALMFAMHSPNVIPQRSNFNSFIDLDMGTEIHVTSLYGVPFIGIIRLYQVHPYIWQAMEGKHFAPR
ncbi:unnamed protein product, partial [Oppiella nova]